MFTLASAARRTAALVVIAALPLAAAGCARTVSLDAAPSANDPGCAEIMVRLPSSVGDGLGIRYTNSQATSAWGDPTAVILRCGIEQAEVSALPCLSVNDIDWLVDDSDAPNYRFETYGRTPATEVIVDTEQAVGATVLEDLSLSISSVEATKQCGTITNEDTSE